MRLRCLLIAMLATAPAAAHAENAWFTQGRAAVDAARELDSMPERARNVILFLGDGMSLATVTAARILEGQLRGEPGEENRLAFERLPHLSLAKTYNTDQQVPDSAGTMTAIMSGAKTRAGLVGLDASVPLNDFEAAQRGNLPTLLEQAEDRGMSTGVVTTARLTHATPAATYAHSPQRGWENDTRLPPEALAAGFPDIARQFVEWPHGDGIDVALGGGRQQFTPNTQVDPEYPEVHGLRADGRDLIAEWRDRHPDGRYIWQRSDFDALDPVETPQLLGLFQPDHMRFEHDRPLDGAGEPSLAELTEVALALLSRNPKGYVLVVEGGRIDHAHHMGNAYRALLDTVAMSRAVEVAMQHTDPADTLIVVTADHGHVMTLGGYPTRGNPILGKVVANDRATGVPKDDVARDDMGLPYTTLGYYNGRGAYTTAPKQGADHEHEVPMRTRRDLEGVDTSDPDFKQVAAIPLYFETHSGEDVPVYAGGPGSQLFHGVQEQSYLYHAMVEALGWRDSAWRRGWRKFANAFRWW